MITTNIQDGAELRPLDEIQNRLNRLVWERDRIQRDQIAKRDALEKVIAYLRIADAVEEALDQLSAQLFEKLARKLEGMLTDALSEVLDQRIALKVTCDHKRGRTTMGFHIERGGKQESIMKGQGGSVANILSVGLRMFALSTLDPAVHRRFLVLDEQDCWLRPDLVPKLVKIVHDACRDRKLGFQVIMISHHDVSAFARYADKIYQFTPSNDGVKVRELVGEPSNPDI